MQVNIYEAKTTLSSLVDRAARGEEVVIARAGKPMVRLVPVEAPAALPPRILGQLEHLGLHMPLEMFAPMTDAEVEEFYGF